MLKESVQQYPIVLPFRRLSTSSTRYSGVLTAWNHFIFSTNDAGSRDCKYFAAASVTFWSLKKIKNLVGGGSFSLNPSGIKKARSRKLLAGNTILWTARRISSRSFKQRMYSVLSGCSDRILAIS